MRLPALLSILLASLLCGCAVMVPGHLYPVQGPLTRQSPPPVFKITMSGVLRSGTLTATLADGEVCTGDWTAVRQDDPSAGEMAAQWDAIYGQGFFVANVLGTAVFARAVLTGSHGTRLRVQLYDPTPGQVTNVRGIAADDKGNLYKLTF